VYPACLKTNPNQERVTLISAVESGVTTLGEEEHVYQIFKYLAMRMRKIKVKHSSASDKDKDTEGVQNVTWKEAIAALDRCLFWVCLLIVYPMRSPMSAGILNVNMLNTDSRMIGVIMFMITNNGFRSITIVNLTFVSCVSNSSVALEDTISHSP
jgi:hypothetical protein